MKDEQAQVGEGNQVVVDDTVQMLLDAGMGKADLTSLTGGAAGGGNGKGTENDGDDDAAANGGEESGNEEDDNEEGAEENGGEAEQKKAPKKTAGAPAGGAEKPKPGKESPLFGKKADTGKGGKPIIINTSDDLITALGKEGLMDPKKPETFAKLFNNVRQWRSAVRERDELKEKVANIDRAFDMMDTGLVMGIGAWSKGKDWRAEIQSLPNIDFNVALEDQDAVKLIATYVPGVTVTKEQIEKEDPVAKNALALATTAFNKQLKDIQDSRTIVKEQAKQRATTLRETTEASLKSLDDIFPGMLDNSKNAVKSLMLGGPEKLLERLVDKKTGGWLPESAKAISLLMYGEDELLAREEAIQEAENKVHKVIDRGEKEVRKRGGGKRATDTNVAEVLSMVPDLGGGSVYESRQLKGGS